MKRLCYILTNLYLSTRGAIYLAEIDGMSNPFEPDLVNTSVGKWKRLFIIKVKSVPLTRFAYNPGFG